MSNTSALEKVPEEKSTKSKRTKEEVTQGLLSEIVEQLKLANSTLEEIHEELHEFTNRGGY